MFHSPPPYPAAPGQFPPLFSTICLRWRSALVFGYIIGVAVDPASLALADGHELQVLRTGVVGTRADDLVVDALLDDVRGPARGARDHEQRREHRRRHAHHVVA